MKKSVIILIAVIYVASIALVSFFGLKFKTYDEKVYVEKIEITNTDGIKYKDDGSKYVVIRPDANGELKYKIEYVVTPDNATEAIPSFRSDPSITYVSIDEETGVVTFDKSKMPSRGVGAVEITLVPKDGSDTSDKIEIRAFAN